MVGRHRLPAADVAGEEAAARPVDFLRGIQYGGVEVIPPNPCCWFSNYGCHRGSPAVLCASRDMFFPNARKRSSGSPSKIPSVCLCGYMLPSLHNKHYNLHTCILYFALCSCLARALVLHAIYGLPHENATWDCYWLVINLT